MLWKWHRIDRKSNARRGKFGPIFLASDDRGNGVKPGQLFLGYLREYPRALEESRDQRAV